MTCLWRPRAAVTNYAYVNPESIKAVGIQRKRWPLEVASVFIWDNIGCMTCMYTNNYQLADCFFIISSDFAKCA